MSNVHVPATQSTITEHQQSASFPSSTAARTSLAGSSSTTPEASTSAQPANTLLEIHCSDTFIPELNDSSSQAFKDRAKHVEDSVSLNTLNWFTITAYVRETQTQLNPFNFT